MDSDPFAIWDTPSTSTSQSTDAQNEASTAIARLSLEDTRATSIDDDDPDPGWGLPSPQKTRRSTPPPVPTLAHEEVEEDAVSFQDSHTRQPTPDPPEQPSAQAVPPVPQIPEVKPNNDEDDDDGFQDFDQPEAAQDGNDDFGDFDDFEEGDLDDDAGFDDDEPPVSPPPAAAAAPLPSRTWSALTVTKRSKRDDVAADIANLLPLSVAAEQELTPDVLRQVPGEAQVLVAETSRTMWKELCTLPSVKPIDWVRSKTRRDYLISMGIPVNLDEIHTSRSVTGGLPPLKLDMGTGSGSHLASSDSAPRRSTSSLSRSNTPSRNGTSSPATGSRKERMAEKRRDELGLGAPPIVDLGRAQELVDKTESQLTLMSLPALQAMLRELHTMTTSTSVLLTHHLTLRESYQADSEMYNSMIKQLVTGAASRVSTGTNTNSNNNSSAAHGLRGGGASALDRRANTLGAGASLQRHPTPPSRAASINRSSAAATTGSSSTSPSLRGGAGAGSR